MTLPVSIVVPTRNCQPLLSRYMGALVQCVRLAEQIVVVDSESTDGSFELLQRNLHHPNARFLSVPPGLYQSWNRGLRECTARYSYLATAGDAIDPEGLRHLVEVAEQFQSDAVMSPPRFVTHEGEHRPGKEWGIHQYLRVTGVTRPVALPRTHVFVTSAVQGLAGFMGSSASNLYRTHAIQACPFPTDCVHSGDGAWGLGQSLSLRMALTPRACAEFVLHGKERVITQAEARQAEERLLGLARETLAVALAADELPRRADGLHQFLDELWRIRQSMNEATMAYDGMRAGLWPWYLRSDGWRARLERNRQRDRLLGLWRDALSRFDF